MAGKHIAIFEPVASGHQTDYLRAFLAVIASDHPSWRVTVITSDEAARHESFRAFCAEFTNILTVRIETPPAVGLRVLRAISPYHDRQWALGTMLNRAITAIGRANIDFVLLPQTETLGLWQLALRPRLCQGLLWGTVSVGISFHHHMLGIAAKPSLADHAQRLLLKLVLANSSLAAFASVNPLLSKALSHPKLVHTLDPVIPLHPVTASEARAFYGLRPTSFVILVFGFLAPRKAIDLLLEATAKTDPSLDITILLAGRQHTRLAPTLDGPAANALRAQNRLVEANRYILAGVDAEPLFAANLCWVLYRPEFVHNSGVLLRAGQAGVPCLGRNAGLVGHILTTTASGIALENPTVETVTDTLTQLARNPGLGREMGARGRQAFAAHTPEGFARPLIEAIARRLPG